MCGPIAALIGRHPQWQLYLVGRICGFTLACTFFAAFGELIAWEMGSFQGVLALIAGLFMIGWDLSLSRFLF